MGKESGYHMPTSTPTMCNQRGGVGDDGLEPPTSTV